MDSGLAPFGAPRNDGIMNLRLGDARRALQEIEVAAFVGLADML
jgi:hypothetical protein